MLANFNYIEIFIAWKIQEAKSATVFTTQNEILFMHQLTFLFKYPDEIVKNLETIMCISTTLLLQVDGNLNNRIY